MASTGTENTQRWRARHPERYEASQKRMRAKRDAAFLALLEELKSVPCMDCGGTFPRVCMDFDHRPGEVKTGGISKWPRHDLDGVRAEAAKCDVVCANCHRLRTAARWGPQ